MSFAATLVLGQESLRAVRFSSLGSGTGSPGASGFGALPAGSATSLPPLLLHHPQGAQLPASTADGSSGSVTAMGSGSGSAASGMSNGVSGGAGAGAVAVELPVAAVLQACLWLVGGPTDYSENDSAGAPVGAADFSLGQKARLRLRLTVTVVDPSLFYSAATATQGAAGTVEQGAGSYEGLLWELAASLAARSASTSAFTDNNSTADASAAGDFSLGSALPAAWRSLTDVLFNGAARWFGEPLTAPPTGKGGSPFGSAFGGILAGARWRLSVADSAAAAQLVQAQCNATAARAGAHNSLLGDFASAPSLPGTSAAVAALHDLMSGLRIQQAARPPCTTLASILGQSVSAAGLLSTPLGNASSNEWSRCAASGALVGLASGGAAGSSFEAAARSQALAGDVYDAWVRAADAAGVGDALLPLALLPGAASLSVCPEDQAFTGFASTPASVYPVPVRCGRSPALASPAEALQAVVSMPRHVFDAVAFQNGSSGASAPQNASAASDMRLRLTPSHGALDLASGAVVDDDLDPSSGFVIGSSAASSTNLPASASQPGSMRTDDILAASYDGALPSEPGSTFQRNGSSPFFAGAASGLSSLFIAGAAGGYSLATRAAAGAVGPSQPGSALLLPPLQSADISSGNGTTAAQCAVTSIACSWQAVVSACSVMRERQAWLRASEATKVDNDLATPAAAAMPLPRAACVLLQPHLGALAALPILRPPTPVAASTASGNTTGDASTSSGCACSLACNASTSTLNTTALNCSNWALLPCTSGNQSDSIAGGSSAPRCAAAVGAGARRCFFAVQAACAEHSHAGSIALRAERFLSLPRLFIALPSSAQVDIGSISAALLVTPPAVPAFPGLIAASIAASVPVGGIINGSTALNATAGSTTSVTSPLCVPPQGASRRASSAVRASHRLELIRPSGTWLPGAAEWACAVPSGTGAGSANATAEAELGSGSGLWKSAADAPPVPGLAGTLQLGVVQGSAFGSVELTLFSSVVTGPWASFGEDQSAAAAAAAAAAATAAVAGLPAQQAAVAAGLRAGRLAARPDPVSRALLQGALLTQARLSVTIAGAQRGFAYAFPIRHRAAADGPSAHDVVVALPTLAGVGSSGLEGDGAAAASDSPGTGAGAGESDAIASAALAQAAGDASFGTAIAVPAATAAAAALAAASSVNMHSQQQQQQQRRSRLLQLRRLGVALISAPHEAFRPHLFVPADVAAAGWAAVEGSRRPEARLPASVSWDAVLLSDSSSSSSAASVALAANASSSSSSDVSAAASQANATANSLHLGLVVLNNLPAPLSLLQLCDLQLDALINISISNISDSGDSSVSNRDNATLLPQWAVVRAIFAPAPLADAAVRTDADAARCGGAAVAGPTGIDSWVAGTCMALTRLTGAVTRSANASASSPPPSSSSSSGLLALPVTLPGGDKLATRWKPYGWARFARGALSLGSSGPLVSLALDRAAIIASSGAVAAATAGPDGVAECAGGLDSGNGTAAAPASLLRPMALPHHFVAQAVDVSVDHLASASDAADAIARQEAAQAARWREQAAAAIAAGFPSPPYRPDPLAVSVTQGWTPATTTAARLAVPPWNDFQPSSSSSGAASAPPPYAPRPLPSQHLSVPLRLVALEIVSIPPTSRPGETGDGSNGSSNTSSSRSMGAIDALLLSAAGSNATAPASSAAQGRISCPQRHTGVTTGNASLTSNEAAAARLCGAAQAAVRRLLAHTQPHILPAQSRLPDGGPWGRRRLPLPLAQAAAVTAGACVDSQGRGLGETGTESASASTGVVICAHVLPSLASVEEKRVADGAQHGVPSALAGGGSSSNSNSTDPAAARADADAAMHRRLQLAAWREAVNGASSVPALFHIASGMVTVAVGGVTTSARLAADEARVLREAAPPFDAAAVAAAAAAGAALVNAVVRSGPALANATVLRQPPVGLLLSPSRSLDTGIGHDDVLAPPQLTTRVLTALPSLVGLALSTNGMGTGGSSTAGAATTASNCSMSSLVPLHRCLVGSELATAYWREREAALTATAVSAAAERKGTGGNNEVTASTSVGTGTSEGFASCAHAAADASAARDAIAAIAAARAALPPLPSSAPPLLQVQSVSVRLTPGSIAMLLFIFALDGVAITCCCCHLGLCLALGRRLACSDAAIRCCAWAADKSGAGAGRNAGAGASGAARTGASGAGAGGGTGAGTTLAQRLSAQLSACRRAVQRRGGNAAAQPATLVLPAAALNSPALGTSAGSSSVRSATSMTSIATIANPVAGRSSIVRLLPSVPSASSAAPASSLGYPSASSADGLQGAGPGAADGQAAAGRGAVAVAVAAAAAARVHVHSHLHLTSDALGSDSGGDNENLSLLRQPRVSKRKRTSRSRSRSRSLNGRSGTGADAGAGPGDQSRCRGPSGSGSRSGSLSRSSRSGSDASDESEASDSSTRGRAPVITIAPLVTAVSIRAATSAASEPLAASGSIDASMTTAPSSGPARAALAPTPLSAGPRPTGDANTRTGGLSGTPQGLGSMLALSIYRSNRSR